MPTARSRCSKLSFKCRCLSTEINSCAMSGSFARTGAPMKETHKHAIGRQAASDRAGCAYVSRIDAMNASGLHNHTHTHTFERAACWLRRGASTAAGRGSVHTRACLTRSHTQHTTLLLDCVFSLEKRQARVVSGRQQLEESKDNDGVHGNCLEDNSGVLMRDLLKPIVSPACRARPVRPASSRHTLPINRLYQSHVIRCDATRVRETRSRYIGARRRPKAINRRSP